MKICHHRGLLGYGDQQFAGNVGDRMLEVRRDRFARALRGRRGSDTLGVRGIPSIANLSSVLNLSGNHFGGIAFAGVTVRGDLGTSPSQSDNAGLALSRTRDEAVREIVLANNALRTSLSTYKAATAVASAAKTTFDAALAAYHSGVGSIIDATMAETQLQASLVRSCHSRLGYWFARCTPQ
jgi:hypothetical protein